MKEKSKVNLKVYLIVNSIATVLGIAIFTGTEFVYKNATRIVNDNELMVAIKM